MRKFTCFSQSRTLRNIRKRMLSKALIKRIEKQLAFTPTSGQQEALEKIAEFLMLPQNKSIFIMRGYAGTGKTSLTGALVRTLKNMQWNTVLLAPTGRAAKVFSLYADAPAYTIHKMIYRQKTFVGEETGFSLDFNKYQNTLFIVDEASMIANRNYTGSFFGTGCLLDDLVQFVYQGEGCRLLFVGDTAQLPPVGEEGSPALNPDFMSEFGFHIHEANLTQVVRQAEASGILRNATSLREKITSDENLMWPRICLKGFSDIKVLSGNELVETLESSYYQVGIDQTIIITRSNKRANVYNNGIRGRIFGREGELTQGDLIMIAKNNYYWTELALKQLPPAERPNIDFIANGDIAEIRRIRNIQSLYGSRFADVTLRFPDYDDFELNAKILLNTLQSEAPALSKEESNRLFHAVLEDYADIPLKKERMKHLRQDPYYNALQIKYAYAITCHKAQGGQWQHVYLDQGYITEEMLSVNYLRWLYTAFTRSSEQLYLMNWPKMQQEETTDNNKPDHDKI